jgi:hypothetical protein
MATIPSISPLSKPPSLDEFRKRIDRLWIDRIERFARRLESAWQRFSEDFEAVSADEFPAEELAPLFTAFAGLQRLGVRFDPRFIAKMDYLRRDMAYLNVDGDADTSDDLLDLEDSDQDASDEVLEDGWGEHPEIFNAREMPEAQR